MEESRPVHSTSGSDSIDSFCLLPELDSFEAVSFYAGWATVLIIRGYKAAFKTL